MTLFQLARRLGAAHAAQHDALACRRHARALRVAAAADVCFLALLPCGALASNVWQINLVGDLYAAGRDVPHPTPDQPVYYFPVVTGYAERGARLAGKGEEPPPKRNMVHDLAVALAAQGYRVTQEIEVPANAKASSRPGETSPATVRALSPPPALLLVFSWGSLRPEKLDAGADFTFNAPPSVLNQNQMIGLTAGKNFDSIVDFGTRTEEIWDGVQDDRFYVMVSAYDFEAYNQKHKKVLLWVTKMSLPAADVTMAEVLPALIKVGGPLFGRETIGPKVVDVPNVREGRVEVGTPTVVPPDKK